MFTCACALPRVLGLRARAHACLLILAPDFWCRVVLLLAFVRNSWLTMAVAAGVLSMDSIRQEETRQALDVHKAHLACLVARCAMVSRWAGDPTVQAAMVSCLPGHLLSKVPRAVLLLPPTLSLQVAGVVSLDLAKALVLVVRVTQEKGRRYNGAVRNDLPLFHRKFLCVRIGTWMSLVIINTIIVIVVFLFFGSKTHNPF